jgi:hypothetical protein
MTALCRLALETPFAAFGVRSVGGAQNLRSDTCGARYESALICSSFVPMTEPELRRALRAQGMT